MSAGNPPRALTGRETQKQQFRTMLGRLAREMNEPSMIVFGLRGVGKQEVPVQARASACF